MGEYYFSLNDIIDKAIGTDAYFQIKSILTSTKPADVAPVRHGRWIEYMKVIIQEPYNKREQAWKCSECGFDDGFIADPFCLNCGAMMDLEEY